MDRLDAMRLFTKVAELGSFSAAAQQAGMARSVVTRQIAALEGHLGVKLMARSTRRLTLTSAGTAYLEKCRVILNLVEAAETDLAEERSTPRGHIRVSLPLSYGLQRLTPLLIDFSQRHPEVSLDMDYSDRRLNLIEEGVDLSIRITHRLEPGDVARRLGAIRMMALAAPDYLARHGEPRHPAELAHHPCLGYINAGRLLPWQFMVDGQLTSHMPRGRLNANNGEVLAEAAARGMGITCHPDFIAERFLREGRLVEILQAFRGPAPGIYAMLPGNRHVPHRVRVLMDALGAGLAEA